jgi:uncharacterized pyridoxamine 5'-phosphate oxidase family protein
MAAISPNQTTSSMNEFMVERHLGILTLVKSDGRPHSTPVGFMWNDEKKIVQIITWSGSLKSRLLEKENLVGTISQVEGGRWVTFEGTCSVTDDIEICADAIQRYSSRYSPPKDRGTDRRTITVVVSRILLSTGLAS